MLAPFVYEGTIFFYKNIEVLTYLPNNLSLYGFQPVINGVFDNNFYHSINGSLWTIRYEFSLYIALSLLYFFRNNTRITKGLLSISLVGSLIMYNFFLTRFAGSSVFGMLGYEILDLGTFFVCGSLLASFNFDKIGDMSYGIYIYSFPVQQALMCCYALSLYQLMFWSLVISIVLGYLSWHLVEKKALRYKSIKKLKPLIMSGNEIVK